MTSLEEMRRELRQKFEGLRRNPLGEHEVRDPEAARRYALWIERLEKVGLRDPEDPSKTISPSDPRTRREIERLKVDLAYAKGEIDLNEYYRRYERLKDNPPTIETVRRADRATVYEVDGRYTVHLYGPWAGPKIYTGLKSVSFPALTRWERIDERTSRAVFPHPTNLKIDVDRGIIGQIGSSSDPERLTTEEIELCADISKKLRETGQIYIIDHDMPLSISKGLSNLLDARRRLEARKRGVPQEQFEFEDVIAVLLGLE